MVNGILFDIPAIQTGAGDGGTQAMKEEMLVSAVPLALSIDRGRDGELRVLVDGFDPITVAPSARVILRPEGHGVVIEREI
jgi:hypothetical protein